MPPVFRARHLLSLCLLLAAAPQSLWAQESPPSALLQSPGAASHHPALVMNSGAHSLAINPAMLALLPGAEAAYLFHHSDHFASGHSLQIATPLFSTVAVGGELHFPTALGHTPQHRAYRLGAAMALGSQSQVGIRYDALASEEDRHLDRFSTWTLALNHAWLPELHSALVIQGIDTPRYAGDWLAPTLQAALGFAMRNGTLRFSTTYTHQLDQRLPRAVGAELWAMPIDGYAHFLSTQITRQGARLGTGATLDFGPFFLNAAAFATAHDQLAWDGLALGVGWRSQPQHSLLRPAQRWVRLRLPGQLDERQPRTPWGPSALSLAHLLMHLDRVAEDPSIDGLLIHVPELRLSYSQVVELRQALARIGQRGKPVVAYLEGSSTRAYYLASVADRLYINPAQGLYVTGLSMSLTFYHDLLTELGVVPQFVKIDRYKTAPDAYLRAEPSPEHLHQLNAYLDGLFERLLSDIAISRALTPAEVSARVDAMPLAPTRAMESQLIDAVIYPDEIASTLAHDFGVTPALLDLDTLPDLRSPLASAHRVAIIFIDGLITGGQSTDVPLLGTLTTGADTISALLEETCARPDVAAIILRIDSPGGSAVASDLIYRAVSRCGEFKPIIASMGGVAASGGYYVAAAAQRIFATPVTITGSIGIFAGKFDLSPLLARLGVHTFLIGRGKVADLFSPFSAWDEDRLERMQAHIAFLYDLFVEQVAQGRHMSSDQVRALGEGRIWSGSAAVAKGLVDSEGGLLDAVAYLRRSQGMDGPITWLLLPPRGPWSAFQLELPSLTTLSGGSAAALIGVIAQGLAALHLDAAPLALLPYRVDLH